jgi:hypothetical protein
MVKIFISHHPSDGEFARRLAGDLDGAGIETWVDYADLRPGDPILTKVAAGINSSDYMVVILSRHTTDSGWVKAEIAAAIASDTSRSARDVVFSVRRDNVLTPPILDGFSSVDFSNDSEYNQKLAELLRMLHRAPSRRRLTTAAIDMDVLSRELAEKISRHLYEDLAQKRARPAVQQDPDVDQSLVFVICSFSARMNPIFEGIKAAAAAHHLRAERTKDIPGDYRITDKIIDLIRRSRFVVVDLTEERPNVYFELGYARGIGKTVVTVAREETKLHFDVKDWTCMFYDDSRTLEKQLSDRFEYEVRATGEKPSRS